MPQLSKSTSEKVTSSGGTFDPLPVGPYVSRLVAVEVREGAKAPYWSWEYEVVDPPEYAKRRLWNNTSLSERALWKMQETFKAFGVAPDCDTDELVGRLVVLAVTQQIINGGNREGEMGNQVAKVMPYEGAVDDFEDEEPF